ncbi:hypothetical protein [Georgenia thermotolerans]|uniref:DUF4019 domain-containing protein n=1 Tax=Georgenia thermotolerans TaxID=527326 RepID=A0A7J5UMD0_9MICO|nr:hypothetical protein [Georgenia thermotolerans]KAE8763440.1 hypothetical protein GB883_14045 [Georgenia thermotolerans]
MAGAGRAGATAVLAVALLAACSPTPEPPSPSPTTTATLAPSSTPSPTDSAPMEGDLGGQDQEHTPPVWDEAAKHDAEAQAVAFMRAFARPDLPARDWLAGIQPLMAPEARTYYAAVDPRNVPPTAVTGTATAQDWPSAYVATVVVGTDAGDYAVTLTRTAAGAPWLVQHAEPAGG